MMSSGVIFRSFLPTIMRVESWAIPPADYEWPIMVVHGSGFFPNRGRFHVKDEKRLLFRAGRLIGLPIPEPLS